MAKLNNLFAQHKGWILMEVLIGTVIIAVALTALALTFTQASKGTVDSRTRLQALSVAQQELEDLKKHKTLAALTDNLSVDRPAPVISGSGSVNYTVNSAIIVVTSVAALTNVIPVQVTVSSPTGQLIILVEYLLVN